MLKYDLPAAERIRYEVRSKPKVGDRVWWRSRPFTVVSVEDVRMRFTFDHKDFRVTGSLREAEFNSDIGMWVLPGTEGEMPKKVRGEWVYPEEPRCPQCGNPAVRVGGACYKCHQGGR